MLPHAKPHGSGMWHATFGRLATAWNVMTWVRGNEAHCGHQ
eukprot:COSAG02_NODE_37713_length_438_cov_1.058997_2_plen_40_part_01